MSARALRLFLVFAAALACAAFTVPPRISYTLTPVFEADALQAVQFDVEFRGDRDGETILRLPNEWGGKRELWRGIEGLTVISGAEMRDGAGPALRVLTHAPGARIRYRYRVIQDWEGEPAQGDGNPYRPVVQPGYFHLIGEAALVMPEIDGASPVRFRVRDLPRDWAFASDLEHRPLILAQAHASVIVGGDFRIVRASEDRSIRVAVRGAWSFADQAIAREIVHILAGQRLYFGDRPTPFLVTVLPLRAPNPGSLSVGGTGLDDAFAFFATPNAEAHRITRTLAHETTHTWIPHRIGGMPREGEAVDYWLSEGFTDFLAFRLLVRDGVWTPAQWADDFNRMLRDYAQSPARNYSNAQIVTDFWSNYAVQQLPYQRGRFLATLWDFRLRALGRDIDDVLLEMRDRSASRDPLRATQMFPLVIARLGFDARNDIATYVEGGADVVLPENALAPCGRLVTSQIREFHRGFDIDATSANGNTITGVNSASPAYAAGLRDGMRIVRRDGGEIGNAEIELVYVVRDGESERTIRYMPRGERTFNVQQLILNDPLEGEALARCVRVLGGA